MGGAHSLGHRVLFAPPPWPEGGRLRLSAEESRHAGRALRLGPGDPLTLVDGDGRRGRGVIERWRGSRLEVRLDEAVESEAEPGPATALALPLLRAPARTDWVVEKATELGVRALRLFAPARGVRRAGQASAARRRRWEELARAAMKQSGRCWCPRISLHASLGEALGEPRAGERILAADPRGVGPQEWPRDARAATLLLLVVGPEGGWSPAEEALLREREALGVRLGPHRLRSETAAVALCALAAARAD
ncbi:MAG: 16S rRNA (uracil(1498)-N(3))-methyltransferase [Candidatus Eisenbacteria bacterium]|uniref:Ribosomal RNA small subunit methyltransferase E n=1 Tax=Eiseniibacteriota bacterium TaxID=2212470 RepID=A0A938BMF1_UNCEI|nr:16S rRNA (uracil(1498)-N(3))-methyltransferase [Candidatus Eisenbacteria bacterium]